MLLGYLGTRDTRQARRHYYMLPSDASVEDAKALVLVTIVRLDEAGEVCFDPARMRILPGSGDQNVRGELGMISTLVNTTSE